MSNYWSPTAASHLQSESSFSTHVVPTTEYEWIRNWHHTRELVIPSCQNEEALVTVIADYVSLYADDHGRKVSALVSGHNFAAFFLYFCNDNNITPFSRDTLIIPNNDPSQGWWLKKIDPLHFNL